ncbi:MAG: exonuclease SbcCD subunit D C-terminal domain-containing protein [Planctomycetota bacterium]|nr:exonuclease SbcCD subunit D C-terminal domain-containing protein [Planctomycetota bacterium]
MLKVFHTADWHLGQSFCGFDRDFEHARFFEWLLASLESHRPDVMIVSGDIFDTINPSAVSQKRLYDFLSKVSLVLPEMQIVLTAGNHDAAARLEAPAPLLCSMNIHVVGTVLWNDQNEIEYDKFLIPIRKEKAEVAAIVLAVPFLRPSDVPYVQDANIQVAIDPYLDGIVELYRKVTEAALKLASQHSPTPLLIAMGHCHVSGGDESRDSERRIIIGGSESIGVSTFSPDIAYVALGHLHKTQSFDHGRIRYSGSPIPLSFAESHYRHQVIKLTFSDSDLLLAEELLVPRAVQLLKVPEKSSAILSEVIEQLESLPVDKTLPPEQHPFLEVRVREEGPDPTRRRKIEQALEGKPLRLASIKIDTPRSDADTDLLDPNLDQNALDWIQPEEVFLGAYEQKYQSAPDDKVLKAFHEVLQKVLHTEGNE